ncbi:hypothetical protein C5E16_14235 [Clavibacter michiganensis]|uniref:DUF3039 domain-containing protein n=1 Tax=Clavibacter michiganensis TaxID=28447 RepID=A0A2S5VNS1_9MICO|nr:DUF3039 domain-containing protein [Clavibacter michiganensis]PPF64714.1 hypothetical protein C5E16_14235 [Clavibacter michiganensis]
MGRGRRITLRCAVEDLHSAWTVASDLVKVKELRQLAQQRLVDGVPDSELAKHLRQMPPLSRLGHPLIHAFDDQFSGDDDEGTLRETISAVNDRPWFKQSYSSRWRGAAVVLEDGPHEIAWLGAAGYHRAGSPEDFYVVFATGCSSGSDAYLPQAEDKAVQKVESKVARRDAWKLQLHLTALVLMCAACDDVENSYSVQVLSPDGTNLLTLTMTVFPTELNGAVANELLVELNPSSWEAPTLWETAGRVVCSAVQPKMESWTAAPLSGAGMSFATVLTEEATTTARLSAQSGQVDASTRPGEVRMGTVAHYAPRDNLTYATVAGEAVRAICGHWFVPTADHEHLPHCVTCQESWESMPAK